MELMSSLGSLLASSLPIEKNNTLWLNSYSTLINRNSARLFSKQWQNIVEAK